MGSAASRHLGCLGGGGGGGAGREVGQLDEELGHSFCYVRSPRPTCDPAFRSISGASVSANSSAPLPLLDNAAAAPAFQSSSSFAALPLQLSSASGPLDRGFFLSGPIERGALSGPLDPSFSGPLSKKRPRRARGGSFSGALSKVSLLRRSLSERSRRPWVVPLRGGPPAAEPRGEATVQWARGKAGEDRAHVVVSEDRRWLFVGIYDGFNGPDAPDYLLSHLYPAVHRELDSLFWDEAQAGGDEALDDVRDVPRVTKRLWEFLAEGDGDGELSFSASGRLAFSISKVKHGLGSWRKDGGDRGWFPRWRSHAEEKTKSDAGRQRWKKARPVVDHQLVLEALSRALVATEAGYLEMTDRAMNCSPELALMGSCLLVVVMRDEDVYVMNVGDSRAIVAQYRPHAIDEGGIGGTMDIMDDEALGREGLELEALQLSTDHNTNIAEEVLRIREEHPDDDQCIVNDRVKGRLKVTRAFGAGFLKQPKWNNALLEMFRNEYIGTAPYISCAPSLCHHKLGPDDQFLVLSSDGLYQYLSNQEVVLYVENFMEKFPDGDPAQSLIEELLFRAAKKAGMDFYELLDIPQGDRRKYHDDVTVMVISLEGRIWKSSGKCL